MVCIFSKKNNFKIKIVDLIDKDERFNDLQTKENSILRIDSVCNVPKIMVLFDDYYPNSMRLQPRAKKNLAKSIKDTKSSC